MKYETEYETSNRVTWISKPDPFGTREHIIALGGVRSNGLPWGHTLDEVVALIDRGEANFHVEQGRVRVALETYWHGWRKYLRTKADGIFYDNLLALPNIA